MGYKKGLAIFIDILGTKTGDFCTLYNLNQIFHKELTRLKKRQTLCHKFVTSFSDCAYIIYTINEKDVCNESVFHLFIHDSLDDFGNAKVPDTQIVWCTITPNDTTYSIGRKK